MGANLGLMMAGGAAQGILEGQLDNQRRAEFNYLQSQRQRALQQQALEDQLMSKLQDIPTTYDEEDRTGMAPDAVGPSPGIKRVTRSAPDVMRDASAAMVGSRLPQYVAQGFGLQGQATQQEAQQLALQREKAKQAITQQFTDAITATQRGDWNSPALMQYLNGYNSQSGPFNDGRTARLVNGARGPMLGFFDQNGTQVGMTPLAPQHITPMLMDAYKAQLAFHDPEYMYKNTKADAEMLSAQGAADTGKAHLGTMAANTRKVDYETTGLGGQADLKLKAAQANKDNAYAGYLSTKGDIAAAKPMKVDLPIFDPSTGKTTKTPVIITTDADGNRTAKDVAGRTIAPEIVDRALGHATEEQNIDEELGRDVASARKRFETGNTTLAEFTQERAGAVAKAETAKAKSTYSKMNADGRANALVDMLSGGAKPDKLAAFGATPEEIKAAQKKLKDRGSSSDKPPLASYGINTPAPSSAPPLQAQINDLNTRLRMEGVDPMVRLQWKNKLDDLVAQRDRTTYGIAPNYTLATPLPGSR